MSPGQREASLVAPPPPIGPRAVDPKAPALRPSCFGIEDSRESPLPAAITQPPRPSVADRVAEPISEPEPARPRRGTDDEHRTFTTEVDVCELDERGRPDSPWAARARELSRGEIVISSRRMCYTGRHVLVLIHLVDHTPVAVYGVIQSCEYDGDGQYRVEIGLMELPTSRHVREWIAARSGRPWRS